MYVRGSEFPEDVYLDIENGGWLKPVSESQLMIDITSILSFIAGRIQTLKPRSKSVAVKIGQSVATIESGKYFGAVRSPMDAKLLEFNPEL